MKREEIIDREINKGNRAIECHASLSESELWSNFVHSLGYGQFHLHVVQVQNVCRAHYVKF